MHISTEELNIQTEYWNGVATTKMFTHPLPFKIFGNLLFPTAIILDYGCGYGRTCAELKAAGYANMVGVDISAEMIDRGRRQYPDLDLRLFDGKTTNFADDSFDACLLLAVLTCIPFDEGQNRVLDEINRILRPKGILFISDYPLQKDIRNRNRYQIYEKEFGMLGIFRTESAVFRHFDKDRIDQLLSHFDILWEDNIQVCTMNGNKADVFQIVARKKC